MELDKKAIEYIEENKMPIIIEGDLIKIDGFPKYNDNIYDYHISKELIGKMLQVFQEYEMENIGWKIAEENKGKLWVSAHECDDTFYAWIVSVDDCKDVITEIYRKQNNNYELIWKKGDK